MKVTSEQVRAVLNDLFPGEQWDDWSDDMCRVALASRVLPEHQLEKDNDNQFVIYTGVNADEL